MRKFLFALLIMPALVTMGMAQKPHHPQKQSQDAPVIKRGDVPSYHAGPPRGAVAPTLNPAQFSDPRVQAAYAMAAKVEKVLYQQPCYCHCDDEVGHHSLLDCYTGTHASICETCLMEGIFAYEQTKKGSTPRQIRAAIERGEWKNVNLNSYIMPRTY